MCFGFYIHIFHTYNLNFDQCSDNNLYDLKIEKKF